MIFASQGKQKFLALRVPSHCIRASRDKLQSLLGYPSYAGLPLAGVTVGGFGVLGVVCFRV